MPSCAALMMMVAGIVSAQTFDLERLPSYSPARTEPTDHCHGAVCNGEWGVIRVHGSDKTVGLLARWQQSFQKIHPNIRYANYTVPNAFAGLAMGTHDIAIMGHTAWRSDVMAFKEVHGYAPTEIAFATGGFVRGKGNAPAPVFFVSKDNPLASLTVEQLDGILGAERSGGWTDTYEWTAAPRRGPESNIRYWGQLGLTGEWADQPIRLYGFDATLSNWSELIQRVVFGGGHKWNPALVEMVRGGSGPPADARIVEAVASDKYAIGFNLMRVIRNEPSVKALPVAPRGSAMPIHATEETIFEHQYPLTNKVYMYVNRKPGEPLSPRIKEFLSFVLSRQGQTHVMEDETYIPLSELPLLEQRERLK